jgi:hypothetical protein
MHLIAILIEWLLGFFGQRAAPCKALGSGRKDGFGWKKAHLRPAHADRQAVIQWEATNFGWMNVASVYEERRPAPPGWDGVAPAYQERPVGVGSRGQIGRQPSD